MTQPNTADLQFANDDVLLKEMYKGNRLEDAFMRKMPFLAVIPKDTGMMGRKQMVPIVYSEGTGRSNTFAQAQAYDASPSTDAWELNHINSYGYGTIAGDAMDFSKSSAGAVIPKLKLLVDTRLHQMAKHLNITLFRDGNGAIGTDDGTWTSPGKSITLSDPYEISNFEVGMELKTGTAHGSPDTGSTTIESINRSTGTLTSDTAIDSDISAFATGDYIYPIGDAYDGSSYKVVHGLSYWVPSSAPSDSTFGIDRSLDSRLGGLRLDASSYPTVEEAILTAASECEIQQGSPDLFVLHPKQFIRMVKELGSRVRYERMQAQGSKGASARVGFSSIVVDAPSGPINVLADPFCPSLYGWCLEKSKCRLYSNGKWPKWISEDGSKLLRLSADDGFEFRLVGRGQFCVSIPGHCCHVTMPT